MTLAESSRDALPSAAGRRKGRSEPLPLGDGDPFAPILREFEKLRLHGFDHGSEVELARTAAATIRDTLGSLVFTEGRFWFFNGALWADLAHDQLRAAFHALDGAGVGDPSHPKPLKMGSRMIDGVLREMACSVAAPGHFDHPTDGIPAQNGLIRIGADGAVSVEPHAPDHRRRFLIAAPYEPRYAHSGLPGSSLVARLLTGVFQGDSDREAKVQLIEEALGAAAAGFATKLPQPKAIVFYGPTARNGKSTVASLVESLLPPNAVSHISPAHFEDERRVVHLAGKAANVCDELGGASIAGESLKAAVTGDMLSGRDVHRSAVEFRPQALHLFTTNVLPPFRGGLDKGLQRRLIVLQFNRKIPEGEIIPAIAESIRRDELNLLLTLAVRGMQRLAKNRAYTLPSSSRDALNAWINTDAFSAWAEERLTMTTVRPLGGWPKTKRLFDDFKDWARDEGYRETSVPVHGRFTERLKLLDGVEIVRVSDGREARNLTMNVRPVYR